MKKHLSLILVLLPVLFLALPALAQERKKVGVVLSGGGAKGVAHIQALKVIEEAGIPIDYIVGTSMGSIIGGLYSIGYTPQQLDSMVRKQDWMFLLSDRVKRSAMSLNEREKSEKYVFSFPFTKSPKDAVSGGIIKGQNLANLFTELTVGYHDSVDFNKLPIPFACVSQNIVNGEQIVFHNGILATAMRASMAIPGVFTPVRKDSMILTDGGMINNYPVDVARSMGADIIIGVDVQNNLKGIDVKFPLNVMTVVTGVSGSGKSSLVRDIFYEGVKHYLDDAARLMVDCSGLEGDMHLIKGIEFVDQNSIGKSSRSNPVTDRKSVV